MPRLSDRRLPRRNHYQEGPGFLFVATQGGRPPSGVPVERVAAVVRRRRAALRRLEAGEPAAAICAEVGCSRASLYRWRTRHARGGIAALLDRPRRGRPSSVPPVVERVVITVRLLSYWNSRRLAHCSPRLDPPVSRPGIRACCRAAWGRHRHRWLVAGAIRPGGILLCRARIERRLCVHRSVAGRTEPVGGFRGGLAAGTRGAGHRGGPGDGGWPRHPAGHRHGPRRHGDRTRMDLDRVPGLAGHLPPLSSLGDLARTLRGGLGRRKGDPSTD